MALAFALLLLTPVVVSNGVRMSEVASGSEGRPIAEYSRLADSRVIEIRRSGGMVRWTTEFRLFGDGRLEIERRSTDPTNRVIETCEASIPEDLLAALVQKAAFSGLADISDSIFFQKRKEVGRQAPQVSDDATYRITISLEAYSDGTVAPAPRLSSFHVASVDLLAQAYPEIQEYAAARDLLETINHYNRSAECRKP